MRRPGRWPAARRSQDEEGQRCQIPEFGKITDEKVARLRAQFGVDLDPDNFLPPDPGVAAAYRPRHRGFNWEVTPDGIRHFVNGYGDDNPLYCDEAYAAGTRWGGLIAPPTFVWTRCIRLRTKAGWSRSGATTSLPPGCTRRSKPRWRATRSRHRRVAVRAAVRVLPPAPTGRPDVRQAPACGRADKRSSWGGRAVHTTFGLVSWNTDREIVHLQRGTWIRAERKPISEVKEIQPGPEPYSDDEIEEIEAAYRAEVRRGGEPRFFEDVAEGEELPTRVKGPFRVTDVILWHAGFGQAFPTRAFRLAYETRRKSPGLFTRNGLNVPDIVQRMHWDLEWAEKVGAPERYDYGALRETFLCQLVGDWAGDDAWLFRLDVQHRKFNYVGDTTWLRGRCHSQGAQGRSLRGASRGLVRESARGRHVPGVSGGAARIA